MSKQQLDDDVCYEVMSFLETKEVLTKCLPLSKQWYSVAISRLNFNLSFNDYRVFDQFIASLPSVDDAQEVVHYSAKFGSSPYFHKVTGIISFIGTSHFNDFNKITCNFVNLTSMEFQGYALEKENVLPFVSDICKSKSLRNLVLRNTKMNVDHIQTFLNSPLADQLESLVLPCCGLTNECIQLICASMKNLTALDVSNNVLTYESGLKVIATSPNMKNLKSLNVGSISGIPNDVARLYETLPQLTSLNIDQYPVGLRGCNSIYESFKNLTCLYVGGSSIGVEGVKVLSGIKTLKELSCPGNNLGVDGCKQLGTMTQLTNLNIAGNDIGAEGCEHISNLINLTFLVISGNAIGAKGAKHISKLINLKNLSIPSNALGDEGAIAISQLVNLRYLVCTTNEIAAEGALAIANNLRKLEELQIGSNPNISDEAAMAIVNLPFLKEGGISRDKLSEEAVQYCREIMPRGFHMFAESDWGDYGMEE